MIDIVDADGDGYISFDEFKNSNLMHGERDMVPDLMKVALKLQHDGWDADNDGQVTEEELAAIYGEESGPSMMNYYDSDDNGVITLQDLIFMMSEY